MDFAIVLTSPAIKARVVGLCLIIGCKILQGANYNSYLGPCSIKFVNQAEWKLISSILREKGIAHLATVGIHFGSTCVSAN